MADDRNYSTIERPYDAYLERNESGQSVGEGSEGFGATEGGLGTANDAGGTENSPDTPKTIKDGSIFTDIFLDSWIKSKFYIPKKQGFMIDARKGYIECMELFVGEGGIVGGSLDIPNKTADDSWHVDNDGNMWSGDADWDNADFRVTNTGVVRIGATPSIFLDGPNLRIRTSTYTSGLQGFSIESDGSAEFNNITARGEFHSQVLSYGEVHGSAGTQVWTKSGGKLKNDVTTATTPTTFNIDIDDPDTGHIQVFDSGDILRIKDGSGNDNWMTITSVSDEITFFRYVCTKDSGTNATFRAGAAVFDYGASGQGVIKTTVDEMHAPFIDIFTHAGSPWTTVTERVRLGNLEGLTDPVSGAALSGYGLWTDNVYLTGGLMATTVEVATNGYIRSGMTDYASGPPGFWLGDLAGNKYFAIGDPLDRDNLLTYNGSTGVLTVKGQTFDNQTWFGSGEDGAGFYSVGTTFTRDMYFTNLTIGNNVAIDTGGYAVFVSGMLTMGSNSKIGAWGADGNFGGAGSGSTGGSPLIPTAARTTGRFFGSLAGAPGVAGGAGNVGAAGAVGTTGTNGTAITNSLTNSSGNNGVSGGKGGAGTGYAGGAAGSGGYGGGVTSIAKVKPYNAIDAFTMIDRVDSGGSPTFAYIKTSGNAGSGGGGGAGGGSATGAGGGGGASGSGGGNGGITLIVARKITLSSSSSINCNGGKGGDGGNGGNAGTNAGGGGGGAGGNGGNGGIAILIYQLSVGADPNDIGRVIAEGHIGGAGGVGGAGSGSGSGGYDGTNGTFGQHGKTVIFKI